MAKGGKLKEWKTKRKWRIKVKTWMLLLILVPLLFIDATLLRQDHIRMVELRDAVLSADARIGEGSGDEQEVVAALADLKNFVFSNIVVNVVEENGEQKLSFGTGPFYLEQSYLKAANKALEEAEAKLSDDSNPNGNIYGEAGVVCKAEAIRNGWSWNSPGFINCMITEIQKYPAADEITDTIIAELPSTELYRLEYASPVWAPTLTGIMILITIVVIVVIFIRMVLAVVLWVSLLVIKI